MADNTTLDSGSGGDVIATDDIGGVKYQRVKPGFGADGSYAGDVSMANPFPVQPGTGIAFPVTDNGGSLTMDAPVGTPVFVRLSDGSSAVSPATAANQATEISSLASIDAKTPALGQALAAASVPVVLTAAQVTTLTPPAAITGFATETTLGLAAASLSVMDDWDESDRAKVNIVAGQVGISAGAGIVATNTPRTTLASDDPAVTALGATGDAAATQGSTGSVSAKLRTVTAQLNTLAGYLDGVEGLLNGGLPAGLGAHGGLVIEGVASGTTVPVTGTLTANIGTAGTLALESGGNLAAVATVEGATTDAVVAAGAVGTISAKLRRVTQGLEDLKTAIVIAAGDNNIGNVDIVTVPADPFGANADAASATGSISAKLRFIAATGIPITGTVTVGSHAVTNAGTFAVQDSQVIADDAVFTPGTSKVFPIGFQADETATDSVDEGDVGCPRMTLDRVVRVVVEEDTDFIRVAGVQVAVKRAKVSAAASGDNTIVSAVASKKILVLSLALGANGAVNIYFKNATDGGIFGDSTNKWDMDAGGAGFVLGHNPKGWFKTGTNNEALVLNLSGAVAVAGSLTYAEV